MPAHQLAGYRISRHGKRYRVLPERGVSSYIGSGFLFGQIIDNTGGNYDTITTEDEL